MGCQFEIYLHGLSDSECTDAASDALDEVERLEAQLSRYRPDSDISRINAEAASNWVGVEGRLFDLLERCIEIYRETDGCFDIATGAITQLWQTHRQRRRVPSAFRIRTAVSRSGTRTVNLQPKTSSVRFSRSGIQLDLGAVGKGYAVDRVVSRLRRNGVADALVNAGNSTLYAIGSSPGGSPWKIGLQNPVQPAQSLATIFLQDSALSTSANTEQYFIHKGIRYGHIIVPSTGRPASEMASVSVLSPSAAISDAYATALFVMGWERAQSFCEEHPNLSALLAGRPAAGRSIQNGDAIHIALCNLDPHIVRVS